VEVWLYQAPNVMAWGSSSEGQWTSGIVQELTNVAVQQYLTVTEPTQLAMPQPGELQLQCWKGMTYTIEGSSDLATWTSLISLTNLNLMGGLQWTDASPATQSVRFYRAQRAELAHPEALACTEWLEPNLENPAVRIVDARYPQSASAFSSGHIPGAVMVDPMQDLSDPTPLPIRFVPSARQFTALMQRLGMSNRSTVVVYDTEGGLWWARLWWALPESHHTGQTPSMTGLPAGHIPSSRNMPRPPTSIPAEYTAGAAQARHAAAASGDSA
jgi:rhodanese-related sulfurtransferase